jgi:hypothetical protein
MNRFSRVERTCRSQYKEQINDQPVIAGSGAFLPPDLRAHTLDELEFSVDHLTLVFP